MYVITVLFSIRPAHTAAFLREIASNAKTSMAKEPGCRQFDICISASQPDDVFLYELYDSRGAFDEHLASAHFREFNEHTAAWVTHKVVRAFERTYPRAIVE